MGKWAMYRRRGGGGYQHLPIAPPADDEWVAEIDSHDSTQLRATIIDPGSAPAPDFGVRWQTNGGGYGAPTFAPVAATILGAGFSPGDVVDVEAAWADASHVLLTGWSNPQTLNF